MILANSAACTQGTTSVRHVICGHRGLVTSKARGKLKALLLHRLSGDYVSRISTTSEGSRHTLTVQICKQQKHAPDSPQD